MFSAIQTAFAGDFIGKGQAARETIGDINDRSRALAHIIRNAAQSPNSHFWSVSNRP
jgi:hypothetical protein